MSTPLSDKAVRARAMFGLVGAPGRGGPAAMEAPARRLARLLDVPDGPRLTYVTGPSGSGKSCLLAGLAARIGAGVVQIDPVSERLGSTRRAVVDLIDRPLNRTLRLLARAGLADATLFARSPGELSEGERFRLLLAMGMDRAGRAGTMHASERGGALVGVLIVDEFASVLDRTTAACVGRTLGRWTRTAPGVRVVLASAHDDLVGPLSPDLLVRVSLDGSVRMIRHGMGGRSAAGRAAPRNAISADPGAAIVIGTGTIRDYRALARYHYRAGEPATHTRVLAARAPGSRPPVGVLVVSMPTLNGAWRELAWPGRYRTGDKRRDTRRLNREIRTISRVVIDPRWRGLGLARRLVRTYLDDPQTPATESVAAMGAVCPFFRAAGMREYRLAHSARDLRILDALEHAGASPTDLMDPARAGALLARSPLIVREVRLWANRSVSTRRRAGQRAIDLAPLAAASVTCPPVAYAHSSLA